MADSPEIEVEIVGTSIKGSPRILNLTRGQPGRIAVTVYAGKKPVAIVVSAGELLEAVKRLVPDPSAQRNNLLPNETG